VARGWESKSIEEQQSAYQGETKTGRTRPTAEQAQQTRRRDGLELSRKRTLAQIQAASHASHRKMLEETLAELDRQLALLPKL
jgi:hypothetical protein